MRHFILWLGSAGILVVMFGTIYATVQHEERAGANWPQIQIAEDDAVQLDQGARPQMLIAGSVDIARSLAPFVIIYDKSGRPVSGASSGLLNNQVPVIPLGSLQAASGQDYHAVTWQPTDGVRIAAVAVNAKNYYVVSGRNMHEVERNESNSLLLAFLGGLTALGVLTATFVVAELCSKTLRRKASIPS